MQIWLRPYFSQCNLHYSGFVTNFDSLTAFISRLANWATTLRQTGVTFIIIMDLVQFFVGKPTMDPRWHFTSGSPFFKSPGIYFAFLLVRHSIPRLPYFNAWLIFSLNVMSCDVLRREYDHSHSFYMYVHLYQINIDLFGIKICLISDLWNRIGYVEFLKHFASSLSVLLTQNYPTLNFHNIRVSFSKKCSFYYSCVFKNFLKC
jgi:hypothetical protein